MGLIDALSQAEREFFSRPVDRSFVTLTYAQSLDGSIAARAGEAIQISGPESRIMTHQLRAWHDAIMLGIGTVLADDPQLTLRLAEGHDPQPVILDSNLRFPADSQLMDHPCKPWLFRTNTKIQRPDLKDAGIRIFDIQCDRDLVSLFHAVKILKNEGIHQIMVEGGATVLANFIKLELVDYVIVTIAPIFVGGFKVASELTLSGEPDILTRESFPFIQDMQVEHYGDDLVVFGKFGRHR